jgi:hypothetical protein
LTENIKLADELGIGGSPTFQVNGKDQVTGALPADTIKQNICNDNPGLQGCNNTLSGSTPTASVPSGAACGG